MMRQELLPESKALYFRYAPPGITRHEYSNDVCPSLPYPKAKPWECSAYYYWWLFLREHQGYRNCCLTGVKGDYAALYEDFGNVHVYSFPVWWRSIGRRIFSEPRSNLSNRLEDNSEAQSGGAPWRRDKQEVTIGNPIGGHDKSDTILQSKYSLLAKPNLKMLYRRHKLLTLIRSRPQIPLWRALDISEGYPSDRKQNLIERNQKSMIARRYYQEAECMVDYTGKGIFPVRCQSQVR